MHDLLIIRHGESKWNLERRWQGWRDAPLTELGVAQAEDRAAALVGAGFAPGLVHCSDLGRARQTAEIIARTFAVPCRPDLGFRERAGGDWEGHTLPEIDVRWPGMLAAWRSGETSSPPGGEDDRAVLSRFDVAIAKVVEAGTPALVVTHHGALRLVAARAGMAVNALIPNLGGYWFDADNGVLSRPEAIEPLDSTQALPATE